MTIALKSFLVPSIVSFLPLSQFRATADTITNTIVLPFPECRINGIMLYIEFCLFHFALFLRFIHVALCINGSFIVYCQVDIPLYEYAPFCLTIHQLMDIWIIFIFGY